MNFSDTELSTISNGLTVASERFRENAAELRSLGATGTDVDWLSKQFDKQAVELDAIIERMAEEAGV